jgi:hypothetical protein
MDVKYIRVKIFFQGLSKKEINDNGTNIKPLSLKGIESKITILLGM